MNRLAGKTALITGASSGIGQACAELLAADRVNLILVARREDRLIRLKEKLLKTHDINVTLVQCDVSRKDDVALKFNEITRNHTIDILINNAGLAAGLEKMDEGRIDDWEAMIDTNIKGVLYVGKAVIPQMRKNNSGHIVNLGSIAGEMAYPGGNVYCATKAAVKMLNDALNIDLVGTNIRVFNICPGAVNTNFSMVRFKGDQKRSDGVYAGYEPLTANDIADLIVYVLNAPAHVNIQSAVIMPTSQRNSYVLHRNT